MFLLCEETIKAFYHILQKCFFLKNILHKKTSNGNKKESHQSKTFVLTGVSQCPFRTHFRSMIIIASNEDNMELVIFQCFKGCESYNSLTCVNKGSCWPIILSPVQNTSFTCSSFYHSAKIEVFDWCIKIDACDRCIKI